MSSNGGRNAASRAKSVSTNAKVFRDLTSKLSSNIQEDYIDAAKKLTAWLGSEKAYYMEARPQIVTMLETASYTLARLLGLNMASDLHISRCTPDLQPRMAAYAALVQTVKPFLSIFLEDHLKARLVNIFSTIYVSPQETQDIVGTSADLTRRLSAQDGRTAIFSPSLSSSTTTPITSISRRSVSTSPWRPETYVDERADNLVTPHGPLRTGQTPLSRDSFTVANLNSLAASQSDSPATFPSTGTRSSESPHFGSNRPLVLQKTGSTEVPSDSENAPATTSSGEPQLVRSAVPPAARAPFLSPRSYPGSIPLANPSVAQSPISALSQQVLAQEPVTPSIESPCASPTTSNGSPKHPAIKRQGFPSAKFELLAALDKKSWKKTAHSGTVSQEQGKPKDDNSEESGKSTQHNVPVAAPVESLGSTHVSQEFTASSGVGSTPQITPVSHQTAITAMSSTEDMPPNDQVSVTSSMVVEQDLLQPSEFTRQMVPHVPETIPGRDIPTSGLPTEKPHAYNLEVSTPLDEDPIGQQNEAIHRHIKTSIPSVDGIERQHNFSSPQTHSGMDVSLISVTHEATGGGSAVEVEVERVSSGGEIERPASVPTSLPAVNTQRVSHGNETARLQPDSKGESVSFDEGARDLAVTSAASETLLSPNGAAPVDVGPARVPLLQPASPTDQTSNDITPGAANSTPTDKVEAPMSDTKRKTLAAVATHILKGHGNADAQERERHVDDMVKHLSLRLDDVFTSGADAGKFNDVLRARMQSLGGGSQGMSENSEESSATRSDAPSGDVASGGDPTASQANMVLPQSSAEVVSSGRKRARSVLSDDALSERPSDRARTEVGADIGERSPAEVVGSFPEDRAGSSNDRREDAAGGDSVASEVKHLQHKSLGEGISSGRKRARSVSLDDTLLERPLNRPRKEGGEDDIGEKLPAEVVGALREEEEEEEEESNDRVGGVASPSATAGDDPLSTVTTQSTRAAGGNPVAANMEADQTGSDVTGEQRGLSENQSSQVAVPVSPELKRQSYQPDDAYEIVSIVEGSPAAVTQDIRFELDEEQAALVKRWADRYDTFDQSAPCMSFTLICTHHLPYGQTWGRNENEKDTDETSQEMAIQWPSGGGFWITVEADDRPPVSIPLSPPYWIEGHEPLDLSNVVGKGTTKIRFTQTRDHSQYLFVLRAHRPTKAQLDEFDRTSLTGQMWTRTLARVAAPLPADLTGGILLS